MNRRCGSSKPTPTPLNGLALKPGKTRRKVTEGNADTRYDKANHPSKPAAHRQCGGGGETKKALWQFKPPQNPPLYRQRGGGARGRKVNGTRTQARRLGKSKSKPSRRLPSWRRGETKGENQHEMERWHNPQSREGREVPS